MASKVGRITGQVHNVENGVIVSTTLFFHDGTKVDVAGEADILLGVYLELTGNEPSPYTLVSVVPVQNGST